MNKSKKTVIIFFLSAAAVLVCSVIILTDKWNMTEISDKGSVTKNTSSKEMFVSIAGTWLYTDGTKYQFDEDMTGGMYVGDYKYGFVYEISDNNIKIDYNNNEVHDSVYEFGFEDGKLKLIGGEGTAGGEYLLERIGQ